MKDRYEMTGTVIDVGAARTVGQKKPFQIREVVVEELDGGQYPNKVAWELTHDKADAINNTNLGAKVTIAGHPESREWTGKDGQKRWFTSMRAEELAFAIEDAAQGEPTQEEPIPDDLPF